MNPPPLPNSTSLTGDKSFAHHAAFLSLRAPVLVILIAGAQHIVTQSGGPVPRLEQAIAALAILLLTVVGLGLAIAGLCGIPRYGSRGILSRGIIGVLCNGILLLVFTSVFITGFNNGVKSRQFFQHLADMQRQAQVEQQKSFDPKIGLTNVNTANLERIRSQLDGGAQSLSGDDALIARALSRFASEMADAVKHYQFAKNELDAAHVLNLANLTDEQQIAPRREVVQRFIAANTKWAGFISNSADHFRGDLTTLQVPPDKVNAVLNGFRSKWTTRGPLILRIRDCDNRIGQGMLGILDVLDRNWGRWDYNAASESVKFDDADAGVTYLQFLTQIRSAGQEQIELQRELLTLPQ